MNSTAVTQAAMNATPITAGAPVTQAARVTTKTSATAPRAVSLTLAPTARSPPASAYPDNLPFIRSAGESLAAL